MQGWESLPYTINGEWSLGIVTLQGVRGHGKKILSQAFDVNNVGNLHGTYSPKGPYLVMFDNAIETGEVSVILHI